jgi:DNA-binding MarR family transcriptional regulator
MAKTFTALDPDAQLGYLLARAAQQLERPWAAALRAEGINPRQFSMLAWLAREPTLSQAELARRVLITAQSASESLAALLDARLITRKRVPSGLKADVRLTAAGKALLQRAYPIIKTTNREGFQALTPRERDELGRLLEKLLQAGAESA